MTEELNELGLQVGLRRVGRLMRQNGIRILRSRKFKRTTDSDHAFNIAPNLLQQNFTASGPNQKWAGDITYIWTREGCYHPNFLFNQFSMLERCALRKGNVHSADGWRDVLDPVRDNEVRLQLHALAYNLATFLRCIALPKEVADWSEKQIKDTVSVEDSLSVRLQ